MAKEKGKETHKQTRVSNLTVGQTTLCDRCHKRQVFTNDWKLTKVIDDNLLVCPSCQNPGELLVSI